MSISLTLCYLLRGDARHLNSPRTNSTAPSVTSVASRPAAWGGSSKPPPPRGHCSEPDGVAAAGASQCGLTTRATHALSTRSMCRRTPLEARPARKRRVCSSERTGTIAHSRPPGAARPASTCAVYVACACTVPVHAMMRMQCVCSACAACMQWHVQCMQCACTPPPACWLYLV